MPKLPHELTDDELASMYGESLRRQLLMKREELKWIRTAAITAIVSLVVLGVCAIVGVAVNLIQ
ncbi:hypothetical protein VIBNISOn1_470003 [Vibrio nigripulchritudo SOn1]|uniref:Uncharacterized protein n=1 Tax=Vibrio nigripulchritudo SOn1 TaxID=1238450 RepID=A0AAV2VUX6_9VIBR|nr:hypothetical protein [Vibrio nigripulchritudo]CCO48198.1 hypothetical protein VIBNISOn1_470003 [Vibrio nigripulchritudo SOn1]